MTADFDQYRKNTYYLHMTSEDISKDLKYMMDFNQPKKHDCNQYSERNQTHTHHQELSNLKSDSEFSSNSQDYTSSDSVRSASASCDRDTSSSEISTSASSQRSTSTSSQRSTSSSSQRSASLKKDRISKHRRNKTSSKISDVSNPFLQKNKYIPLPSTSTPSPHCYHHHHLVTQPPPCICLPHADVNHHLTNQLSSQTFDSSSRRDQMEDDDQESSLNDLLQPPLQDHSRKRVILENENVLVSEDHENTSSAKLCENKSSHSERQQNQPKNLLLNNVSCTSKLKAVNLSSKDLKTNKTANMLLNDDKYADFVYNKALQHLLKYLK